MFMCIGASTSETRDQETTRRAGELDSSVSLPMQTSTNGHEQQEEKALHLDPSELHESARKPDKADSRQRSGRMYQQASGHQSPQIESYAAAYAAANSLGSGPEQSANGHITQQTTNDAGSYSSFGESPAVAVATGERSSLVSSSTARQLPGFNDYSQPSGYFASYMSPSSNEASYSGQPSSSYHAPSQHHYYKSPASNLPLGYPTNTYERGYPMSSYYDRVAHHMPAASSPFWASTSGFSSGGGLMSSASNAISHWTNGFSIGEIICGLVALAIGAVILGAPFFLIYLALMGNFSGSGTLSLTNPTSSAAATGGASTPSNGRRKRLAVFETMNLTNEQEQRHPDFVLVAENVVRQISPFIDLKQVSKTFKQLVSSIEKHSPKFDSGRNKSI